ncbi:hypothetical protein ACTU45_13805 [Streptomyces sp. 24-1644]|uniref:hypothetical protein n=1 Tax=Streptomyces sp. 24-1644 TaxID=3457315 RepID=UPI003FA7BA6D
MLDAAAKRAEVDRYLRQYARAVRTDSGHPALRGCEEVAWSANPGCPAGIPVLLHGLLDTASAPEATRVLTNVLMDGVFRLSSAMPAALPFLLRLAAEPQVPARSGLMDLLVVAAELSEPVDADNERAVMLLGRDSDHPERERCRAVFAEYADLLAGLPDELISAADRAALQQAAGRGEPKGSRQARSVRQVVRSAGSPPGGASSARKARR